MTFYFNEAHYVQSAENLVYKLYSMEVNRDFTALINLELVGGMSETVWLLAHDFPEDAQWETATQNLYTEGMIEALEESGFQSILELPEALQRAIAGYYSNGKYDEYRDDISKLCVSFDWANDGCKLCPLQHACNAVINEKKVTDRTAIWERGMAEAYEKYMMENMTEEA